LGARVFSTESTAVGSEVGVVDLETSAQDLDMKDESLGLDIISPEPNSPSPSSNIMGPALGMINAWKGWQKVESWIWTGFESGYDDWDDVIIDEAVL
jgi:hypothetical protein